MKLNHQAALVQGPWLKKTFAFSLIIVVSLAGNTLIGAIVYRTETMRKTVNYFIVSMAMSDLLIPIIVMPLALIDLHGGFWSVFGYQLGQTFCYAMIFLQYLSAIVSVESLVLIGEDRFGAVVFPLRPPLIVLRSSVQSPFIVLTTWIVAIGLSFPAFCASKPVEITVKFGCSWQREEGPVGYYGDGIRTAFAVAFALIVVLYSIIAFKLKSEKIPGEQSLSAQEQRVKRQRKVVKMALAIVLTFALCWAPLTIYSLSLCSTKLQARLVTSNPSGI